MKNYLFKIILCTFLVLVVFSTFVFATDENIPENQVVSTNEEVTSPSEDGEILASYETDYDLVYSDMYLFDNNVEISQVVDGNVFVYAGTVKVTGAISGNLFVLAENLDIDEDAIIQGSVFAFANDITISGIVSDVYSMSNNFNLEEKAIVKRNIYVMSGATDLTGQVSRDAYISTKSLSFGEGAKEVIKGNLNYSSYTEVELDEGIVKGEVKFSQMSGNSQSIGSIILGVISNIILALIFSVAIVLISLWFAPKFKDRASEILEKKNLSAFGYGLLVFFGGIVAAFILPLFTYGFGASIGLFLIAIVVIAYIASSTVFSMSVGALIAKKIKSEKIGIYVLFALLVVLALNLIEYIPYIGTPIRFIASMLGLGILCINAYKRKDLVSGKAE